MIVNPPSFESWSPGGTFNQTTLVLMNEAIPLNPAINYREIELSTVSVNDLIS